MPAERTRGRMTLSTSASEKLRTLLSANPLRIVTIAGLVVYLALFAFNTVKHTGRFASDSMNYVNVARNILAGKGITQSTLGFNQANFSIEEEIPTPMTAQAPLYPELIALFSRVGISTATSALLLPAIAYGLIFFLVYRLAAELYDERVALVATGVLLVYEPLHSLSGYALSDVVGTAFVFVSCWLLAKQSKRGKGGLLVSAGLAGGLAFATRYALLPVFGIGVLSLLISSIGWRRKLTDICLYAAGFAIPAGIVWAHNFSARGAVMSVPGGGGHDLIKTVAATGFLFERYLGARYPHLQAALLGLSLIVFSGILIARREFFSSGRDLFFSRRRCILVLWSAGYLIFLILILSHSQMGLDGRFIISVGVTLILLWAALAVRATNAPLPWIKAGVLALLVLAIGREALVAKSSWVLDLEGAVARSQRLTWLATYTTDQDLIIGNDTVDIPFLLNRPFTVTFSIRSYNSPATYEKVVGYARRHCHEYQNIYLVLRSYPETEELWRSLFGDFFADLRFGHLEKYPDIIFVQSLEDGFIFQIVCL